MLARYLAPLAAIVCMATSAIADLSLTQIVAQAQSQFPGSEAFQVERGFRDNVAVYRIDLLQGNRVLELDYAISDGRLVRQRQDGAAAAAAARTQLDTATLTVINAANVAPRRVAGSAAQDVQLNRAGTRYRVEVWGPTGRWEVVINSRNGAVIRVIHA